MSPATYSADPDPTQNVAGILNFYIDDPLGTRRHRGPHGRGPHQARFWLGGVEGQVFVRGVVVMTDSAGNIAETCHSLPFGNGASGSRIDLRRSRHRRVAFSSRKCHLAAVPRSRVDSGTAQDCAATPAEHLFTQHERDAETGNDYFGARYYASSMGRFLTPDWSAKAEPVPYSKLDDPQTLNLYAYVGNNPFIRLDADGHGPDDANGCSMASGGSNATCNAASSANSRKKDDGGVPEQQEALWMQLTSPSAGRQYHLNLNGWSNPTRNAERGCDSGGCGYYGARRNEGLGATHRGADYLGTVGQDVFAPRTGVITSIGYAYRNSSLRMIHLSTFDNYSIGIGYASPANGIHAGSFVVSGQPIGIMQNVQDVVGTRTPPHIHIQIDFNGNRINPESVIPPSFKMTF